MLRNVISVVLAISVLAGCKAAEKQFRKGDYDEAIDIAVKKLVRNPDDNDHILLLEEAFRRANGEDLTMIDALHKEGRPDRWDDIYDLYQEIARRQNKISPLLPLYVGQEERDAEFNMVNVVSGINTAKQNASAYWYALASDKLETGDKYKAREAYYNLQKINRYYTTYKDTKDLMDKAASLGTNQVLFTTRNNSNKVLTYELINTMDNLLIGDSYGNWYHMAADIPEEEVDMVLMLSIEYLESFPEKISTKNYTDSKEIVDHWENVYDDKGNIVTDSLGNPVRTPVYKIINAYVTETWQEKVATIQGELRYMDASGRVLKTVPIKSDGLFTNYYATATGYYEALSQESKNKLGGKPLPFPSDEAMLLQAMQTLKCTMEDAMDDYNDTYLSL
ncbi:MAG: hypothetical protein R2794_08390 [Chitinophagales bacterium]